MKIGFIVENLHQAGGVERVVSVLANSFCTNLKHDITIFTCFSPVENNKLFYHLEPKIKIIKLNKNFNARSLFFRIISLSQTCLQLKAMFALKQYLKQSPHDIMIGSSCWSNTLLPFFSNGAKIIACDHENYHVLSMTYRFLWRIMQKHIHALIVLTKQNFQLYNFLPKTKRHLIPNPNSFTCNTITTCEPKKIIVLSRLSYEKGIDILLLIAQNIKKKLPDWSLDIYGDGKEKEKLIDLAKQLNVDDFVTFHNPTINVTEKLLNSSIYVLPSRREGFSMTLIECQVCGIPAVSFNCNYGPDNIITNGVNGFLVKPGDIEDFSNKIITLAENVELRKKFGKAAKDNSKRFELKAVIKKWDSLLKNL